MIIPQHTENLGTLQNAEGEVIYNVNDFDESVESDYQFDIWRLGILRCAQVDPHFFAKKV